MIRGKDPGALQPLGSDLSDEFGVGRGVQLVQYCASLSLFLAEKQR